MFILAPAALSHRARAGRAGGAPKPGTRLLAVGAPEALHTNALQCIHLYRILPVAVLVDAPDDVGRNAGRVVAEDCPAGCRSMWGRCMIQRVHRNTDM
jgi:hypothetical protein